MGIQGEVPERRDLGDEVFDGKNRKND